MKDPVQFIPFHRPSIGTEEQEEVAQVLASGWLTSGPKASQFEEEFRHTVEARRALAVSSGTTGLHLAMEALEIGRGDEVITTPLTFCATVQSILHAGATPVLADIGEDGNVDPAAVEARITPRTKAIMPVHLGGLPCKMQKLWAIARAHDLLVIEDAAHAIGSRYGGRPIGSSPTEEDLGSDAVVFSLYATKNITSAEGGMIVTGREDLPGYMRRLSLHGIDKDAWGRGHRSQSWKYDVVETGWKYNLSDLQAAVGLAQLRKLPGFLRARRQLAAFYNERFAGLEEIELPPAGAGHDHSWHLYSLRLRLEKLRIDRDAFIEELFRRGVAASVHFVPIPLHSAFAQHSAEWQRSCPEVIKLYHRLASIPLYPALTEKESEHVAEAVVETARKFRQLQFTGFTGSRNEFILNRSKLIDTAAELRYDPLFREMFANRCVLVTGAAGSIGRNLCSRLLALKTMRLIGLDRSENGIFQLNAELRRNFRFQNFNLQIGDVCDELLITELMERFGVDTLIHAAAYKHVPLMEHQPIEAIRNNVLGTWTVAQAAARRGVRSLLLISTDKAANAQGVMGKTKRVSEQIVTALSAEHPEMSCSSIRLGNVLGSDGSVSATLLQQLEEGRPLTITHPEMERYFLLPEEAVHYILRVLTMEGHGEAFVPEMGPPIRILDLARRLALSQGRELDMESDVYIVGLRPGEKISEDLKSPGAEFMPTEDRAIQAVRETSGKWRNLEETVSRLGAIVAARDVGTALSLLEDLIAADDRIPGQSAMGKSA